MNFYHKGLEMECPESVYYPREDSILLAREIETSDIKGRKILEIGCGSGFLSILAAKNEGNVTAVDINPEAVETTKMNAEKNSVKIECIQSDLFTNVSGKFDVIIFNPPYLPVKEEDATYSGGATGREVIERFLMTVVDHLNDNGIVIIVISSLTGEKEVLELFGHEGMEAEITRKEKVPWEELVVIRASRNK